MPKRGARAERLRQLEALIYQLFDSEEATKYKGKRAVDMGLVIAHGEYFLGLKKETIFEFLGVLDRLGIITWLAERELIIEGKRIEEPKKEDKEA